jgi:hypothetical protein
MPAAEWPRDQSSAVMSETADRPCPASSVRTAPATPSGCRKDGTHDDAKSVMLNTFDHTAGRAVPLTMLVAGDDATLGDAS